MIVERYTATPECTLRSVTSEEWAAAPLDGKPIGTWLSIPGPTDWPAWCRATRFGIETLRYRHVLELDTTNVLVLTNTEALDVFHAQYATEILQVIGQAISWSTVARDYQGIVIAPRQRVRDIPRARWYLAWDCASGCIWDADALTWQQTSEFDVCLLISG